MSTKEPRPSADVPRPITRRALLRRAAALSLPMLAGETMASEAAVPAPVKPTSSDADAPFFQNPRVTAALLLNQVGYLPGDHKRAVIPASGPLATETFTVIDDTVAPQVRLRGNLTRHAWPSASGAGMPPVYYTADFDALSEPGRYRLRLADGRLSEPFSVGDDVYR